MSFAASRKMHGDGLVRTTVQIGAGLSTASLVAIVNALQRVPGVLTVDADADHAQALVAHDAAVPIPALIAAVHHASAVATVSITDAVVASTATGGASGLMLRGPALVAIGLAAVLAIVLVNVVLVNSPEKRWLFIIPVLVFWAFLLVRATPTPRS